ncbi:MAG: S24/S26 family peptidase [Cyanobacteria bacterium J06642_11]
MVLDKTQPVLTAGWSDYVAWLLGRRQRFVVRENSMLPTLRPGDVVLAEIDVDVHVGDIVIVRYSSGKRTHGGETGSPSELLLIKRIDNIFYDGGLYLISDNTNAPDARDSRHFGVFSVDQVVGRVTSRLAERT